MTESIVSPLRLVWLYRRILYATTLVEIRSQYAGSLAGGFWIVIGPALLLTLYSTVYSVIFNFRPSGFSQSEYVLYICSGLLPFISFSAALTGGTVSLSANKQVLFNTVFPAELLPMRMVLTHSVPMVSGMGLVIIADMVLNGTSWHVLLVPLVMVFQCMFVTGIVWILSLLNLIVRDIQHMLTYLVLALLIMSPIAYTPEMASRLLKALVYLNPLSYFLLSYQTLIVRNAVPSIFVLLVGGMFSVLVFALGFGVFVRAKRVFADFA